MIALEPEAASIFCKELPVEKFEGGSDNINVFSPGQRYLVLDAGGKNNFNNILESSCNELKPKIFAGLQYSL